MRQRTKLIIGGLTVALALAAAVNTATARRFEVSEQRFLVLFRELTFTEPGSSIRVVCPVNIEGSFHSRTISKVSGQLIGFITEAIVHHPCSENTAVALNGREEGVTTNTLPWHILYLRFIGALPRITGVEVQLNNGGFLITALGQSCLYEASARAGLKGTINIEPATGRVLGLRSNESTINRSAGGILCPSTGLLRGEGTVGTQREWAGITVRLVA